ncbi:hypothetical protein ACTOB_003042 [Actinoplanes oblitus]|uniref:Uncharacterized protein n=1 Tax=Actinoplanes oblitus TaxID=3040509 RepID=A0ABY8WQX3_9ACTN|nr:hypothetical protein [Actinoplanes oblitus]WIM99391.1 hypothetical protein ACTOB_003042 [Actinoplanes oblitus]
MAGNQISIAIVANARPAVQSMAETSSAAERMGTSFDQSSSRISSSVDKISSSTGGLVSKVDNAGHSFDELGEKMGNGASKSAQFAGGIGDLGGALAQIPGPLGSLGSGMEALGPSLMGIVGVFDLLELAMNASSLAFLRTAAASVVQKAAMIGGAVATGVMTAAQWALNAAMYANPIGLVVLAIVALVAIFVIAYKKSETFRNIVTAAWESIRDAAVAVFGFVGDFIGGVFDDIAGLWQKLMDLPAKMQEIGVSIVEGIGSGIQSGMNWIKDKVGDLAHLLPDWLEKILQIHSPSRRLFKSGVNAIRGFALGFRTLTAKDIVSPLAKGLSSTSFTMPSAQATLDATGTVSGSSTTVVHNNTINVPDTATNPYLYGQKVAEGLASYKRLGGVIPT